MKSFLLHICMVILIILYLFPLLVCVLIEAIGEGFNPDFYLTKYKFFRGFVYPLDKFQELIEKEEVTNG